MKITVLYVVHFASQSWHPDQCSPPRPFTCGIFYGLDSYGFHLPETLLEIQVILKNLIARLTECFGCENSTFILPLTW
jgi:hypothetical protein